jgi:hypothetical protein
LAQTVLELRKNGCKRHAPRRDVFEKARTNSHVGDAFVFIVVGIDLGGHVDCVLLQKYPSVTLMGIHGTANHMLQL